MPLYRFQVSDSRASLSELTIEADSESDAVRRLQGRQLVPMSCYGEVSGNSGVFSLRRDFNVCAFTNRLVPLLQAQVPLERALLIMYESAAKEKEREVFASLRQGLHEGKSFSELIRANGNRFPRIYANLAEAGEAGGCLEVVLENLQRFLNESKEQKDFLISSSIYPAVILSITLLVLALVFGVFIPRFAQIFLDMGKALPLPTQILLGFSRVVNAMWPVWLLLILGVVWFFIRVRRGGPERAWFDRRILGIPVAGRLIAAAEIGRFVRTLSVLTGNHVDLLKSVRISLKVIGNGTIARTLEQVPADLTGGMKLSAALRRSSYIPPDVIQMLRVGEESARVGPMLGKVADEMEKSVKTEIKRLLALFEPAVIVLLALVILIVVISIFLAVIEMNNI